MKKHIPLAYLVLIGLISIALNRFVVVSGEFWEIFWDLLGGLGLILVIVGIIGMIRGKKK